jgi:site-specific recombinase XerD
MKDRKMIIKGTNHTNKKTLTFQAHQKHLLQQYLKTNKDKDGYLFIEARKHQVSDHNINNRLQWMFHQLCELNPKVVNTRQIPMSAITNWLKKHPLRETQYLAGYKYVSSTARYQTTNPDDLQQALKNHHQQK